MRRLSSKRQGAWLAGGLLAGLLIPLFGCDEDPPCAPRSPGTVVVRVVPDTLAADWSLAGPHGFALDGVGGATLARIDPGRYTLVWRPMPGWTTPDPDTLVQDLGSGRTVTFTGEYTVELPLYPRWVLIPAGSFLMGAPEDEPGSGSDEYPRHLVTLTRAFLMQNVEVTNRQYLELARWALENGYVTATETSLLDNLDGSAVELLDFDDVQWCEIEFRRGLLQLRDVGFGLNPEHPVKEVSWYGAAAWCDWLSLREGLPRAYDHVTWACNGGDPYGAEGYRLPTEAEWEYACRAGSETAFANGEITDPYGYDDPVLNEIGWYWGNSVDWTHPVALLIPNAWGLYDMHGNLLKWCQGFWGAYPADPQVDPTGGASGRYRVVRGGAWSRAPYYSRSGFRTWRELDYDGPKQGFRPVRSALR